MIRNSKIHCHVAFPRCGPNLYPLTMWQFPVSPICPPISHDLCVTELWGLWYERLDLMREKWHLLETPHPPGDHSVLLLPVWLHPNLRGRSPVSPQCPNGESPGSIFSIHCHCLEKLSLQAWKTSFVPMASKFIASSLDLSLNFRLGSQPGRPNLTHLHPNLWSSISNPLPTVLSILVKRTQPRILQSCPLSSCPTSNPWVNPDSRHHHPDPPRSSRSVAWMVAKASWVVLQHLLSSPPLTPCLSDAATLLLRPSGRASTSLRAELASS